VQFLKETHPFGILYFQIDGEWVLTVMTDVTWPKQSIQMFLNVSTVKFGFMKL